MILLDTDHLSVLRHTESGTCERLQARMRASSDQDFVTSVVSLEEQLRGWLAEIGRQRDVSGHIILYQRLVGVFEFFNDRMIIPFDARSAAEFKRMRRLKVRLSTPDLKIAAIALVNDALLLLANLRDFQRVPGLRVESWID